MDKVSASGTRISLLNRLQEEPNDEDVWNEFVTLYGPKIESWCRRWKLQDADVQDVTQQVLLRLTKKMREFVYDPSRSFRAWLKTLTHHAWHDFVTARQRTIPGSGDSQAAVALQSEEARDELVKSLEEAFDLELLQIATERVRGRVSATTWEAFRLTAMEGVSGAAAAAQLQMKVAAVFKAKSNVQKMLQQEINLLESVTES